MNEAAWAALMVSLTIVCALGTIRAFRTRGKASGMRGLAITLLPVSAWLTGTLEMFTEIAGSVTDWATGLVLNPIVWTGIGLFGTSALLFFASGRMRARALSIDTASPAETTSGASGPPAVGAGWRRAAPAKDSLADDDMADIEEMLRKRGIN